MNSAQASVPQKKGMVARGMEKAAEFLRFKDSAEKQMGVIFWKVRQKIRDKEMDREQVLMLIYNLTVLAHAVKYPKEPNEEKLMIYEVISNAIKRNEGIRTNGTVDDVVEAGHAGIMHSYRLSEYYFSDPKNRADFIEEKIRQVLEL